MGSYRIMRRLAVGGMAEVFLAKVVGAGGFEKPVAIKRVLPALSQDETFLAAFLAEARLTVSLQHANVVQVFDLGALRGSYYMVLEFVDGENLRQVLREAVKRNEPVHLREACFIVQQVADGLAYAHERTDSNGKSVGIVHRDVNPANVMISRSGEVKLADFGIAKAATSQSNTQAGTVKGKTGYLAPEQIQGQEPDQRSDVFLLGILLYETLLKRRLFRETDLFKSMFEINSFDPEKIDAGLMPPELLTILKKALARKPADRYPNARAFSHGLSEFLFKQSARVSTLDIEALFGRIFPGRVSPLDAPAELREEIILESGSAAARSTSRTPTGATAIPRPSAPRGAGLTPVSSPAAIAPSAPRPAPGSAPRQTTPAAAKPGIDVRPLAPAGEDPAIQLTMGGPRPAAGRVRRQLGESLIGYGKLTRAQLDAALKKQKEGPLRPLGELLVSMNLVTEVDLVGALSDQLQVPYVADKVLRTLTVPESLLKAVPVATAEKLHVVPLTMRGARHLVFATLQPTNLNLINQLQFVSGMGKVTGVLATASAIKQAIRSLYYNERTPSWSEAAGTDDHNSLEIDPTGSFSLRSGGAGGGERMFGADDLIIERLGSPPPRPSAPPPAPPPEPPRPPPPEPVRAAPAVQAPIPSPTVPSPDEGAAFRAGSDSSAFRPGSDSTSGRMVGELPAVLYHAVRRMLEAVGRSRAVGLEALQPLGAMAGKVARRLGASPIGVEEAIVAMEAVHLAAVLEQRLWQLPDTNTLTSLLGSTWVALEPTLGPNTRQRGMWTAQSTPTVLAVGVTWLVACELKGAIAPGPDALAALATVAATKRFPSTALEALSAELSVRAAAAERGHVVMLLPQSSQGMALQFKLFEDGLKVIWVKSIEQLSTQILAGAGGFVAETTFPGFDAVSWVRGVRQNPATTRMSVFLIAPDGDPRAVDAALEAGADDVMTETNPAVISAKLRRAFVRQS